MYVYVYIYTIIIFWFSKQNNAIKKIQFSLKSCDYYMKMENWQKDNELHCLNVKRDKGDESGKNILYRWVIAIIIFCE